jgi:hypothetical protein
MTSCLDLPAPSTCQPAYILVWSLRRPVFLINSHSSRFTETAQPFLVGQVERYPLSRSYGVKLPSSFTRVLSSALGYAPRLPVSVLVRAPTLHRGDFLGRPSRDLKHPKVPQAPPPVMSPFSPARPRESHGQSNGHYAFRTPSPRGDLRRWCANVDALSIAYAFRPQLRSRLTLGGVALPRKL